jgi:uncharacterized protein with LGFP repeats
VGVQTVSYNQDMAQSPDYSRLARLALTHGRRAVANAVKDIDVEELLSAASSKAQKAAADTRDAAKPAASAVAAKAGSAAAGAGTAAAAATDAAAEASAKTARGVSLKRKYAAKAATPVIESVLVAIADKLDDGYGKAREVERDVEDTLTSYMDEDERSRALVVGVCAAVVAFGVLTWLTRRR